MPVFKKLSIVIPVLNERETIAEIVRRIQAVPLPLEKEIIAVDDGSKDGTQEVLKKIPGVRAFFHDRNRGKGAALKTGIRAASGQIILLQDADLEYDPEDYPAIIQPILEDRAQFVMGSRFLKERPRFFNKEGDPFFSHYVGNHMIIWSTNFLYGQKNTDYEGCYKAFIKSLSDSIPIEANGFAFDNELICKTLRRGHKIMEVPIHYRPRLYSEGKKIKWQDGAVMLWTIVKWRFLPF